MSEYTIDFTSAAQKAISKYRKSSPVVYKKICTLLDELILHPRTGLGHPEPLKSGNSITYSRRITAKDRMIYDIYDNVVNVLILSIEGHYGDK